MGTVANKLLSGTAKITLFSTTLHYNNSFDDDNQAYFVGTVCYYIFISVLICDDSPRATAISGSIVVPVYCTKLVIIDNFLLRVKVQY